MLLNEMRRAFEHGLGDPNLCSIIIGPRGSGKTALLSCIGEEAMDTGWVSVNTVAGDGMLEDILQQSTSASAGKLRTKTRKSLTGITIGQLLGLEWSQEKEPEKNWRSKMTMLLQGLKSHGAGLLITVDEVHADSDEMIQLASVYQLLIREGLPVALVMAGLSVQVNRLIDDKRVSFLRRARMHVLERISDSEIRRAFRKTVEGGGKKIQDDALEDAVSASGGYPYMMQLVGYSVWEEGGTLEVLDSGIVKLGITAAEAEFRNGVLNSTLRELSKNDIAFLKAMLADDNRSRISDVAERMNKTPGYVSTYKTRMLKAGIIEEEANGMFSFAIPAFRAYLQEE